MIILSAIIHVYNHAKPTMYDFCTILFKAIIVIPTGEGKDRPSLSLIPVAYVYLPVYVYMLTEIC